MGNKSPSAEPRTPDVGGGHQTPSGQHAKKPYSAPRLQVWGPVTELTRGFGGSKGDGQAGKTRAGK